VTLRTSGASAGAAERQISAGTTLLEMREVAKQFSGRLVLENVSLQVAAGEFLTLLGESGSGKTTLLRIIAGFEQPTSGEVWMSGTRLDVLPPYQRRVNTVFQNYALFPHLSVKENVAYGLRVTKAAESEIPARVADALRMVKMEEFAERRPAKLSGGQQQRVALARALVNRPKLLLLDEPLSALDASLRKQMQGELKSLQRDLGITFLFVTHDQDEAMALSDRIALLKDGALEQIASPREIYERPATVYTAQFIGQTNILHAEIRNGMAASGSLCWPAALPDGTVLYSLRPEAIRLAAESATIPDPIKFHAKIVQQIFSGASEQLELDCDGQKLRALVYARSPLSGQQEFAFSAAHAIPVRNSREQG
jgi:spermidine/putrescine transport system ATP-binding protein